MVYVVVVSNESCVPRLGTGEWDPSRQDEPVEMRVWNTPTQPSSTKRVEPDESHHSGNTASSTSSSIFLTPQQQLQLVSDLHRLMTAEFDDLEECEIWCRILSDQHRQEDCGKRFGSSGSDDEVAAKAGEVEVADPYHHADGSPRASYRFFVVLALTPAADGSWTCLGGGSLELYFPHCIASLAYVAVSESARGQGLAKKILKASYEAVSVDCLKQRSEPLKLFTIFVCPPHEGEVDRQIVWSKLGFRPVGLYTWLFVGRLFSADHPHQFAIYFPELEGKPIDPATEPERPVLAQPLFDFLLTIFEAVLAEEDNYTDKNGEVARERARQALYPKFLPAGLRHWATGMIEAPLPNTE